MRHLILTLLLLPLIANAVPVEYSLTWTPNNPTASLSGYELRYVVAGGGSGIIPVSGGATITAVRSIDLEPRTEPYVVTWTILAVGTNGLKSPLSTPPQVASRVVTAPPPSSTACRIETLKLWAAKTVCERSLNALQGRK